MDKTATASPNAPKTLIGQRVKKPDAPDKATGKTRYINDMVLPQMLIGKVLFARRPHARIVRIDTTAAAQLPGVHAVLTGADAAGLAFGFVRDNAPLKDRVRCEHDEIAAVAAETEEIALQALALIEVESPAGVAPVFLLAIAARHDEFVVLAVADESPAGAERLHGDLAAAEAASDSAASRAVRAWASSRSVPAGCQLFFSLPSTGSRQAVQVSVSSIRLIACGEGSTRMGFGSWPTLSAKPWTISGHVLKYPLRRGSGRRRRIIPASESRASTSAGVQWVISSPLVVLGARRRDARRVAAPAPAQAK